MSDHLISISREYSSTPAGRTPADGPFNGQRFRRDYLIPKMLDAVRHKKRLVVSFDDADSFSSSFLEEAFGGLVREKVVSPDDIRKYLLITTSDEALNSYVADATAYISEAIAKH